MNMKTPEEILKMTKEELNNYKWSDDLNLKGENKGFTNCLGCTGCSDCTGCLGCSGCSGCSSCSGCSGCSYCLGCSDCSGCYQCRNAKKLKYAICNVEVGKEAFDAKMKELGIRLAS